MADVWLNSATCSVLLVQEVNFEVSLFLMCVFYPLCQLEVLLLEKLVFCAELFDVGQQLLSVCDVADVSLHLEVVFFLQLL